MTSLKQTFYTYKDLFMTVDDDCCHFRIASANRETSNTRTQVI